MMLTNELADIRPASSKQVWKIRKLLNEREVTTHFAEILRERMATGELTKSEAGHAIDLIEGKRK